MGKLQDKSQEMFLRHCWYHLDERYHRPIVRDKYKQAYNQEPLEYKKVNAGIRAGNLYLLGELKALGVENWRPEKEENKSCKRKPINYTKPVSKEEREAVGGKKSSKMPDKYKGYILNNI